MAEQVLRNSNKSRHHYIEIRRGHLSALHPLSGTRDLIATILGTRAELIKTVPLIKEIERRHIDYCLIHTGHENIGDVLLDFEVRKPDVVLSDPPRLCARFMSKTEEDFIWTMAIIPKISKTMRARQVRYVVYQGDTISTAAAAIGSSPLLNHRRNWKNVHIEAGLRTYDLLEPFPEEMCRTVADRFSDILFAISAGSVRNLERESLKGKIVNVGSTTVESCRLALDISERTAKRLKERDFCLISIHRNENIRSSSRLERIVRIVEEVDLPAYWLLHDNTRQQLVRFHLLKKLETKRNLRLSGLKSYVEVVQYLANCKYMITDGGSMQEESLVFGKPCMILRNKTERYEGLSTGINFLTNLDLYNARELIRKFETCSSMMDIPRNPYGDGQSSTKILDYLDEYR